MAKHRKGGLKLRQEGFTVPAEKNHGPKKGKKGHHHAPWDDPLSTISRGGGRH
jgi:hypothetical protein